MATLVHRVGDARTCGATTTTAGNSSVYADGLLIAVNGDPNTHGAGGLIASANNVYCEGKLVVLNGDSASPDSLCPLPPIHCNPAAAGGSITVYSG